MVEVDRSGELCVAAEAGALREQPTENMEPASNRMVKVRILDSPYQSAELLRVIDRYVRRPVPLSVSFATPEFPEPIAESETVLAISWSDWRTRMSTRKRGLFCSRYLDSAADG